jgi:DUF4097 and DUF4098 domain-containing protein YvlB
MSTPPSGPDTPSKPSDSLFREPPASTVRTSVQGPGEYSADEYPPPGQQPVQTPHQSPPQMGPPPGPQIPTARGGGIVLLRTAGVLLALLIVISGVFGIVTSAVRKTKAETATIEGQVTRLVTTTGSGNLTVKAGAPGTPVTVAQKLQWVFNEPSVTMKNTNGVLTVAASCPPVTFLGYCDTELTVTVPAATSLNLSAGSGDLAASGVAGPVAVDASSGDVHLDETSSTDIKIKSGSGNIRVANTAADERQAAQKGTISLSSGSGNVALTGPAAGNVKIDTRSGDIEMTNTAADERQAARTSSLAATTGSGNITLAGPTAENVRIKTNSGQVEVTNAMTEGAIEARAGSGDLTVQSGLVPSRVMAQASSGEVVISVPSGAAYDVDTSTGSGDESVHVQRNDTSPHKISVKTKSGDITIKNGTRAAAEPSR